MSTYFVHKPRKRSIALDSEFQREAAQARAAVGGCAGGEFSSWGDEETWFGRCRLLTEHPGLIYCSLTGRGRDSDAPGYDLMTQGLSGIPSITGPVDGEPYKCGASIADLVAGVKSRSRSARRLYKRSITGKGGVVDVSMIDGMRSLLTHHASAYLPVGTAADGQWLPLIHPFRPYQVADGFLNVCVGNDALFRNLLLPSAT